MLQGRGDPLESKVNGLILRAHLAPGKARTDIRALASLPPRHISTVRGSRVPLAQYNPQCKGSQEDKVGVHSFLNIGAGNQQVPAKRSPAQQSEAIGPHTNTSPCASVSHRTQQEAGCFFFACSHDAPHAPTSRRWSPDGLSRS